MKNSRRLWGGAILLALAASIPLFAGPQEKAAEKSAAPGTAKAAAEKPGVAEMLRLHFYLGEWDYTETYPKSGFAPNGGKNTGVYTSKLGPGGSSLVNTFHSQGPIGDFEGLLVMTWDAREKAYKAYLFGNDIPGAVVAGRRRRRRLFEQCYVATARGYVLSPELLGKLAADPAQVADTFSAKHLIGLASKVQSELGQVAALAAKAGKRLPTLSINSELRFTSAEQRAAFTAELQKAIVETVGRHSTPFQKSDGLPGEGRPFRLVIGCYPIPAEKEKSKLLYDESGTVSQS